MYAATPAAKSEQCNLIVASNFSRNSVGIGVRLNVLHVCAVMELQRKPVQFENRWIAELKFDA